MVNVKNLLYMGNERKINYLFLFAPQLLRMIEANSSQLRSVLWNIVSFYFDLSYALA